MARKRSMTTQTRPQDKTTKLTQGLPERRYLPELHGVRGLALLGVVLFHLFGNGRISGGIDIFLAVSGFLFTGMLLREAANSNGRIDFFKYFGRLVRRIFVPLAIVAVVTLVAGLLISPVTQHRQLCAEARASLLYFENFELINSQLAYGAAGPETSPFQHIWSLSVQGQFYLLWPFVAILAVLLAKVLKTSAARIMGVLVAVIFVVSFVYAIYVGSYNQDEAYLMTTTRAWELAFGGLLALAGSSIRLPKQLRGVAGWLGVALIATCGIFLDGAALFPGPWAFWPIAGLTLVLISGLLYFITDEGYEVLSVVLEAYGFVAPLGCVWIKDWSEHTGVTEQLVSLGVVSYEKTVRVGPFNSPAHLVSVLPSQAKVRS